MKDKFIFNSVVLFVVFTSTIFGQNAAQVREKHGRPTEAYSVSERIRMTPEFTRDGQICRMRLYPKTISATTNYLSDKMTDWELKEVLERLAPTETRGRKTPFFGIMSMSGFYTRAMYLYEKVGFAFLVSLDPFSGPLEKGEKSPPETTPAVPERKSFQDILQNMKMDVPAGVDRATIVWTKRKCARK